MCLKAKFYIEYFTERNIRHLRKQHIDMASVLSSLLFINV